MLNSNTEVDNNTVVKKLQIYLKIEFEYNTIRENTCAYFLGVYVGNCTEWLKQILINVVQKKTVEKL